MLEAKYLPHNDKPSSYSSEMKTETNVNDVRSTANISAFTAHQQ